MQAFRVYHAPRFSCLIPHPRGTLLCYAYQIPKGELLRNLRGTRRQKQLATRSRLAEGAPTASSAPGRGLRIASVSEDYSGLDLESASALDADEIELERELEREHPMLRKV